MTNQNHLPTQLNKFTARSCMAGLALVISLGAHATPPTGSVSFSYKDWDLICDNTLTCRAAGYSEDDVDPAATVLITREAGPSTPITNRVTLADYDGDIASKEPGSPLLLIDNQSQGKLLTAENDSWQMNDRQFNAFKQALSRDSKISFKDKVNEYIFSGAGSSAVLLKMDDVQGRVGTIGAFMKKGSNSESGVKMPVPLPEIIKAVVRDKESRDLTQQEKALIKPGLMKFITDFKECNDEQVAENWQIANLNETQSLVMVPCWTGAYNSGSMSLVISNDMTSPPEMVTDSATSYDDGVIGFAMKGRGLGDCWSSEEWVWDGAHFVPSFSKNTGRCRLISAGGSWDLPIFKTHVVTR